mmetsp:Transcript_1628/g.3744  ORF Transcript_1628/g.3744 Transcript_1628/m.3744 type:complete len:219 (-) Transcript_1628:176-832(-)
MVQNMLEGSANRVMRSVRSTSRVLQRHQGSPIRLVHAVQPLEGAFFPGKNGSAIGSSALGKYHYRPFPASVCCFSNHSQCLRLSRRNRSPSPDSTQRPQQGVCHWRAVSSWKHKYRTKLHAEVQHICQTLHICNNQTTSSGIEASRVSDLWRCQLQSPVVCYLVATGNKPKTKANQRHAAASIGQQPVQWAPKNWYDVERPAYKFRKGQPHDGHREGA